MNMSLTTSTRLKWIRPGLIVALLSIALVAAVACGGDDDDDDVAPAPAATTAPTAIPPAATTAPAATAAPAPAEATAAPAGAQYGGTLKYGYFRAPTSPDGYQSSGGFENFFIWNNNDPILARGIGGSIAMEESIAESFAMSADGLSVEIKIREGIQFQGGLGELTSEDVKFSFDRWFVDGAEGCRGCNSGFARVASIEAPDRYTIKIVMSELDANIIIKLTGRETIIHSKKHWADVGGMDAHKAEGISTGPYKLVDWQPGSVIKYEAHDDWWQGKPFADAMEVLTISETRTRLAAVQTGQVNLSFLQSEMIPAARADSNIDVWAGGYGREGWNWNVVLPPLNDIRVRRALVKSIDRDALNSSVYLDTMFMGKENCGIAPGPDASDCSDLWQGDWFGFDVDAAKALLEEYAADNGLSMPIKLVGAVERRPDRQQLNEFLQGTWREIGLEYTFETTANVSASSDVTRECLVANHHSTGSGIIELRQLEGNYLNSVDNDVRLQNCAAQGKDFSPADKEVQDQLNALLEEAASTIDDAARNALYKQVDYLGTKFVFETFPLMNRQNFFGCNNNITGGCGDETKGIDTNRGEGFFRVADHWVIK